MSELMLVQVAAERGLNAIGATLTAADAEINTLVVLLSIEGAPAGESDVTMASKGVGSERELFDILVATAAGLAVRLGILFEKPKEGDDG